MSVCILRGSIVGDAQVCEVFVCDGDWDEITFGPLMRDGEAAAFAQSLGGDPRGIHNLEERLHDFRKQKGKRDGD